MTGQAPAAPPVGAPGTSGTTGAPGTSSATGTSGATGRVPGHGGASVARTAVGVAVAVTVGVTISVQSRINGELGARLHNGTAAAVISFGTGLVLLCLLVPVVPAGRRGLAAIVAALRAGGLRWWHCLGGVCGALMVVVQSTVVGPLGVAMFTIALVAGQAASSLLVDRVGIGPSGRHPITPQRLIGVVLAIGAVVLTVADRLGTPTRTHLIALPAVAGMGISWQQAVNGRIHAASGSASSAALINFTAGTLALALACTVDVLTRGWPFGHLPHAAWLYLGGPLGVAFVATAAAVVRLTGVLLLGLATIVGQVTGAVLLDLFAPPGDMIGSHTVLGAGLTVVALAVATVPGRRRKPTAHEQPDLGQEPDVGGQPDAGQEPDVGGQPDAGQERDGDAGLAGAGPGPAVTEPEPAPQVRPGVPKIRPAAPAWQTGAEGGPHPPCS